MAYRVRRYACPDCEGEFDFLHSITNGVEEPPPKYCSLCGAYVGDEPPPIPAGFSIATDTGKSGDQVYRAMEKSSEYRAQAAAAATGMDYKDFQNMRITDMKDNMREGDIAAMTPSTPVSQAMAQTQGTTGFNRGGLSAQNEQFIAAARQGPYAGAGNASRQNIVNLHQRTAGQTVAAGRINKG